MEYDRGDNFDFDFEPNGISFGSNTKKKPATTIIFNSNLKELWIYFCECVFPKTNIHKAREEKPIVESSPL